MKILMICTEKLPVPPVRGGAIQTYISGSLPHLSKLHNITVLGISDASLPEHETIEGIQYVRIPGQIFDLYREGVVNYVKTHSFDLIHIFNRPRMVLAVRQAAPETKITLSMHNDMFNPDKIDPQEARRVIEDVSGIVTVSDYVGGVIRDLYPFSAPKLRTIYSGVDIERFLPGKHAAMQKIRNDIRREHGLENKTVILFAGRLSHNKGVDRLIRALPALSSKHKDLALIIMGSKWFSQNDVTDYVAYVRALAKKLPIPVVSTGFISPSEIHKYFAAADLFVCTSLWQEPLARVHYEAMSAGLPIVTTARGGNPEVILPGENGLVVQNPEDPYEFTEAISKILTNKNLMEKMGERGRELAVSNYPWKRVGTEILEVWEHAKYSPVKPIQSDEPILSVSTENTPEVKQNDALAPGESAPRNKSSKVELRKQLLSLMNKSPGFPSLLGTKPSQNFSNSKLEGFEHKHPLNQQTIPSSTSFSNGIKTNSIHTNNNRKEVLRAELKKILMKNWSKDVDSKTFFNDHL
ncbi:glycosyltransferase family 4 protein [Heyndrickxia acidicola]|uniref:Glycosyltransferase family 4 protein n=1 Tax=Heyndrickxia acidicola TaxID=209389 RepID=A0ABU6MM60_9BACI|nr:glycosyltransferase family 4 protein [Heyndrickxia acidicola]MED1205774.1 glycosyltransferase family 4 protein [Heyndrickxia acidicola]